MIQRRQELVADVGSRNCVGYFVLRWDVRLEHSFSAEGEHCSVIYDGIANDPKTE